MSLSQGGTPVLVLPSKEQNLFLGGHGCPLGGIPVTPSPLWWCWWMSHNL